jgi:hypothetical protein
MFINPDLTKWERACQKLLPGEKKRYHWIKIQKQSSNKDYSININFNFFIYNEWLFWFYLFKKQKILVDNVSIIIHMIRILFWIWKIGIYYFKDLSVK